MRWLKEIIRRARCTPPATPTATSANPRPHRRDYRSIYDRNPIRPPPPLLQRLLAALNPPRKSMEVTRADFERDGGQLVKDLRAAIAGAQFGASPRAAATTAAAS